MAPWADHLYACDAKWWRHHNGVPTFKGEKWTQVGSHNDQDAVAQEYCLNTVPGRHEKGLGKGGCIHYGSNSGYQAINLAYMLGATQIILLGYDMSGTGHWFGDHPDPLNAGGDFNRYARNFPSLARDLEAEGVTVYNCSRHTALECFERVDLQDALRFLSEPMLQAGAG